MLIKRITLENFRQFKGKQSIEFSTNTHKNVTVIKGENGSGKTTLLEAFKWCLYRELNLPNKDNLLTTSIANQLNKNDVKRVMVELIIQHKNKEYIIKRADYYQLVEAGQLACINREFSIHLKDEFGVLKEIDKDEINNIVPKDLSTYFFFDGERIENLSKSNTKGKRDLSQAVRNVLGLDILLNAIKHLSKLSLQFEDEFNNEKSDELNQIKEDLNMLREEKEHLENIIDNTSNEIEIVDSKIEQINEQIKEYAPMKELQLTRETLEKQISINQNDLIGLFKDLQRNNKHAFPEYLASKLLKISSEKLDLSGLKSKGIAGIDGTAIDYIIEQKRCICGQEIIPGSQYYKNLLEQKEYQPPASLGVILLQFNDKTKDVRNKAKDYIEEFERKYREIEEKQDFIDDAVNKLNEISKKLENAKDVRELENQRHSLLKERDKLINKKAESEIHKNNIIKRINDLEKQLEKSALEDERNALIALRLQYVKKLEEIISAFYNERELEIRKELNDYVTKVFEQLITTKHRIEISDDYTFKVIDIDGEESTSQGQDVITSFAFISGLINLAKNKHHDIIVSEPYPLVMDAPFAKLSNTHRKNVAEVLPDITEQFILFTLDSQYQGEIEEVLRKRIGKEYELIMHSQDENNKYSEII